MQVSCVWTHDSDVLRFLHVMKEAVRKLVQVEQAARSFIHAREERVDKNVFARFTVTLRA